MLADNDQAAHVNAWLARVGEDLTAAQLLELFDRAFAALWQESGRTLGETTLWAIGNRVLRTARDRFPSLAALKVEATGISFRELREGPGAPTDGDLKAAFRFLIVDFLVVLGRLTGEILEPGLRGALSKVKPRAAAGRRKGSKTSGDGRVSEDGKGAPRS